MPIITPPTQAESDQDWLLTLILRKTEAMHHLASVSSEVNREFWSLPTERLLALLNADVPRSLDILAGDLALNVPLNASLDAVGLDRFCARAPTVPGRPDIAYDGAAFALLTP